MESCMIDFQKKRPEYSQPKHQPHLPTQTTTSIFCHQLRNEPLLRECRSPYCAHCSSASVLRSFSLPISKPTCASHAPRPNTREARHCPRQEPCQIPSRHPFVASQARVLESFSSALAVTATKAAGNRHHDARTAQYPAGSAHLSEWQETA